MIALKEFLFSIFSALIDKVKVRFFPLPYDFQSSKLFAESLHTELCVS